MKKMLVIKEVRRTDDDVLIKIECQTHRGQQFGVDGTNIFRSTSGYELVSMSYPACGLDRLYVRGDDEVSDEYIITISLKEYGRLQSAVDEYNIMFGIQYGDLFEI